MFHKPVHSFHVFPSLYLLNKHSGKYNYHRSKENKGNQKKQIQNTIKCKARRQSFNILQTTFLEKQFTKQRYINTEQRNKFSAILGLTPQQVKIWYQNRRYKEKIGIKALNNIKSS
uniref:Homeobox domain-containing protein n=1 Tax=Meloidogyne incognita TaxID=6306 RepID=A0A914NQK0_MELIC